MITVACVLKSGGIYTPEWVTRLERAVAEHMARPHRFVCLTDMDVPCETVPLRHDWPGWWAKMEMYRLDGPVLYLDLDIAVVGSLDALLAAPTEPFDGRSFPPAGGRLVAPRDWLRPRQYNTSVVWFEDRHDLYTAFMGQASQVMAKWRGDQEFLSEFAPEAEVWKGNPVASFRRDCRARLHRKGEDPPTIDPPPGVSVVAFHGEPKMPDAPGWPQEYWAA